MNNEVMNTLNFLELDGKFAAYMNSFDEDKLDSYIKSYIQKVAKTKFKSAFKCDFLRVKDLNSRYLSIYCENRFNESTTSVEIEDLKKIISKEYNKLIRLISLQKQKKYFHEFLNEKTKTSYYFKKIFEALTFIGFKNIKSNEISDKYFEFQSLVAINMSSDSQNKDYRQFPILILIDNCKATLKFILTKDTKWFICDPRFLDHVNEIIYQANQILPSNEKLNYDKFTQGVSLNNEFLLGIQKSKKSIQKKFLKAFYSTLSNFKCISKYLNDALSGIHVNIEKFFEDMKNLDRSRELNLNESKFDEPRIIFPLKYASSEISNIKAFNDQVEILKILKKSSKHFYWIDIEKERQKIKYPDYQGRKITIEDLNTSHIFSSLIKLLIGIENSGYYIENLLENLKIYEELETLTFYFENRNIAQFIKQGRFDQEPDSIIGTLLIIVQQKLFKTRMNLCELQIDDFDFVNFEKKSGQLLGEPVIFENISNFDQNSLNPDTCHGYFTYENVCYIALKSL